MKGREVGERAVLGSIGSDCVRVFLGEPEPDEFLCIRRVDIDEAVPLGEKRQNSFLLSCFQLRANVRHLCEHTLPTFPGPMSNECPFRPVTAAAPVEKHLFAVLGTVGLLRTGREVPSLFEGRAPRFPQLRKPVPQRGCTAARPSYR